MTSKKQRRKDLKKAMDMEIREHKSTFIVYLVIRAIVIAVMIRQLFMGNYENVFMCALTLLLLIIPSIGVQGVQTRLKRNVRFESK